MGGEGVCFLLAFLFLLFDNSPESKSYESMLMSSWFICLISP